MITGQFSKDDVARGGTFMVDAINDRTRKRQGVIQYIDRGDDLIEVGYTSEYEGLALGRALEDGASALRYRADRLRQVADAENIEATKMVHAFRLNADLLDAHRKEIAE